jgi:hypothetical protein
MRTELLRRVTFLATFGIATFSGGVLLGQSRHRGLPPAPPPPVKVVSEPDTPSTCTGVACPLHHAVSDPPTYDTIDFHEQQGSEYSLKYDNLCALGLSAPRNTLVLEYTLYQVVIEGEHLEPVYRVIRKRQVGTLQATSIANGDTMTIPVVPLASLPRSNAGSYENRVWGDSVLPLPPSDEPEDAEDEPTVTRVRVVLPSPYVFGKAGQYVREED